VQKWTEASTRRAVRERSGGACELRLDRICLGRATNASHRTPVGRGGKWSPCNVLDACGSGTTGCHGWIEHHRTFAYARGLLLPSGTIPDDEPVRICHPVLGPGWWRLNSDASMSWQAPYEQERP
jgi:hypothetical protein